MTRYGSYEIRKFSKRRIKEKLLSKVRWLKSSLEIQNLTKKKINKPFKKSDKKKTLFFMSKAKFIG